MDSKTTMLKVGMWGNAAFSAATGLTLVSASGPVAAFMGIGKSSALLGVGVALLLFAAHLAVAARRKPIRAGEVYLLSGMDGLWVLGTIVILASGAAPFSHAGTLTFALVGLLVAQFMVLQILGVRRMLRSAS